MWSNIYNYYNIQFDEIFSQKLSKLIIINCLLETGLFNQINHQSFTNSNNFPWVDIIPVETYDGNYVASDLENQFVNWLQLY